MAEHPLLEVRYRGHLDYQAMDALLAGSDIVVVPSRWPEPLGAIAIEAQRAGAAVVVSDVGGLASCVRDGETGLLVPLGDVAGWAQRLTTLARDPQLRRRLADAATAATAAYTIERHVAELMALLEHAAAPAGG
jgi:glycosyltransferase involved in cell wall biosynthesis